VNDPAGAAARWADVLGLPVTDDDAAGHATILLADAGQDLRFVRVAPGGGEGITEVRLASERAMPAVQISGVWFITSALAAGGESP
jgi:hypothetical protein